MMVSPSSQGASTYAIALIIMTGCLLSGMDGMGKYLAMGAPVLMVIWGRYFFHTAITFIVYAGRTRSFKFLKSQKPGLQFLRASSLFIATSMFYFALTMMPLGDAAAIQFLAPVLVTAFSGLFLGEEVGLRRWGAVVCGFIGVLLVARPGSGVLGFVALLPLGTAVFLAAYMMLTRSIRDQDSPAATTFYSTAVGALALSVIVPFHWQPLSTHEWGVMVTMGASGALGHFFLVKAFHAAEASMLAPFTYAQVVAAIIWGMILFGDIPSFWTLAGASLVVGSGVYVWYRERALRLRKAD